MENWIWLLILQRIIDSTCPFTSKVGAVLNVITLIAVLMFCILCFFYAPEWWYGLVATGIFLFGSLLIPKINPNDAGPVFRIYSGIASHLSPIIVLLMYLFLLDVI